MRTFILILMLALAGCGSSDDDSLLATQIKQDSSADKTQLASLTQQVKVLQTQLVSTNDALKKLQLIGKTGQAKDAFGNFITRAISAANFGPCPDMGVLVGFTNPNPNTPADPLSAQADDFKQCTGYYYEVNASDGALAPASRLFFDGPNCTGNMFVWNAGGTSFNDQILANGVVFSSAIDGSQLMVTPGQIPAVITAQSVFIVFGNTGCQPDGDIQPMFAVTPNDVSITGVSGSVGKFQLAPP